MTTHAPSGPVDPLGSSQGGLRLYNERVVLKAIRLHGALPAAELARLTRLTPQTISTISKRLLEDGLLRKGEPVRGKVGQPHVPLSLNHDGAYAVGIKLGRRNLDTLLVGFDGQVRQRWSLSYTSADPEAVVAEIAHRLRDIRRMLGPAQYARLQGVGIAAPLSMEGWQAQLGLPAARTRKWQNFDLARAVSVGTELPVHLIKDTGAACLAELVGGRGRSVTSFVYMFVDTFIGGGLVLDSHLHSGLHGNAGAVGSLPIGSAVRGQAPPQLLHIASLATLEQAYQEAHLRALATLDERALQTPYVSHTRRWLDAAGNAIALAVQGAACMLDVEAVILDGACGPELRDALVARTGQALDKLDWQGVVRPPLLPGLVGPDAMAIGGAMLPLHAEFSPDRELFLKSPA